MWLCRQNNPAFPMRSGYLFISSFVLLCMLAACAPAPPKPYMVSPAPGATGVGGTVEKADRSPAKGAFVYAYRTARHGLRGPADFGVKVDGRGRYFLDLVDGEYHLVARLRQSGADAGPPRPGDAWSIHPGNPIRIEEGKVTTVDFVLQGGAVPRQVREGSLATGDTGFSGRLVDVDGKPFVGAFALAYRTKDFHRMPDLTSTPADRDGRFILYVPGPGRYCLAARSKTRGQPRAGEPYGVLGSGDDACRQVMSGQIEDIGVITLSPYRQ